MKCSRADALRAYMNGELSEQESRLLERHVEGCLSCQRQMESEEEWELGDLQVPSELPLDFSQKVMHALEHLPVPVPKPDWKKKECDHFEENDSSCSECCRIDHVYLDGIPYICKLCE